VVAGDVTRRSRVTAATRRLVGFLTVRRYPSVGLSLVRISYGTCFLIILASNASQWKVLWGVDSLYPDGDIPADPNPGAGLNVFMAFHSNLWVVAVLWCSAIVGIALIIGFQSRLSTIVLLVLHWSLTARNPLIADGGDNLMTIALLLLAFANTGERLSIDNVLRRRRKTLPRKRTLLAVRFTPYSIIIGNLAWMALVAQVCIVYSTSGLSKVQGTMWQDGTAVYYILRTSEFSAWPALSQIVYENGYLTSTASYVAVLVQVFFPFLIFNRFLKLPTIFTVIGMHAGIGILMGLPVFALVMIGTEMIFVPDSFWQRLRATYASRRFGTRRLLDAVPGSGSQAPRFIAADPGKDYECSPPAAPSPSTS
jgi:hypothetical protein